MRIGYLSCFIEVFALFIYFVAFGLFGEVFSIMAFSCSRIMLLNYKNMKSNQVSNTKLVNGVYKNLYFVYFDLLVAMQCQFLCFTALLRIGGQNMMKYNHINKMYTF